MYLHSSGYYRESVSGVPIPVHRATWEDAHGPIADGMEIHHRNGVKTDNRLENLELVSKVEHRKRHAGVSLDDHGVLVKRCSGCREVKSVEREYYRHTRADDGYIYPRCRKCHVAGVVKSEQRRRAGITQKRFKKWRDWMTPPHARQLDRAISELPDRSRHIVRALVIEGRTMQSVSDEVGISVGQMSVVFSKCIDRIDAIFER